MYLIKIITIMLLGVGANTQAFEMAMKPHAMIYLTIPLETTGLDQDGLKLGFRLDNVAYTPGRAVDYQQQLQRTAVLDLRLNSEGLEGVYISGTDYLQLYRVNRQNEGESEAVTDAQQTEETTGPDSEVSESGEGEDDGLTMGDRVKGVISDMRSVAPMGVYMGAALGIGLLLGVDD